MMNDESLLLYKALMFEDGHLRRSQHILKVYALAKLIGEREELNPEEQQILCAAAILHDIPIKYCKEKYGDASLHNQKKSAPKLVKVFLEECNYIPSCINAILELVLNHHCYDKDMGTAHKALIEADLIANCFESEDTQGKAREVYRLFKTKTGIRLLENFL